MTVNKLKGTKYIYYLQIPNQLTYIHIQESINIKYQINGFKLEKNSTNIDNSSII